MSCCYVDVRQTALSGRTDESGHANFIEAINDTDIKALLHFDQNIIDETGTVWTENDSPTYVPGVFDEAIQFDGVSQYIQTEASNYADTFTGLNDWTIRFKMKINTLARDYYVFGQCNANVGEAIIIELTSNNQILVGATGEFLCISEQTIQDNNFHEIAIERHNEVIYIYIDGIKDQVTYNGGLSLYNSETPYQIGGGYGDDIYSFDGAIDEFVIYKRAIYQGQSYTPQTVPTPYIASSLQVAIKASVEYPLILTAADGYNGNGAVDYTTMLTSDTILTLIPNAVNYVYAQYDKGTQLWNFGSDVSAPTYGAHGTVFFNINTMKSSMSNPRVYIGEAEADLTKVISVTTYAIKGRYVGDEFTPIAISTQTENHNIGSNDSFVKCKCALRWNSTDNGEFISNSIFDIYGASQGTSGGQNIGAAMRIDNNKKFSLLTGAYLDGITGGGYSFASMKARMFAERGW